MSGLFCLFQDSGKPAEVSGLASLIRIDGPTEEKSLIRFAHARSFLFVSGFRQACRSIRISFADPYW